MQQKYSSLFNKKFVVETWAESQDDSWESWVWLFNDSIGGFDILNFSLWLHK